MLYEKANILSIRKLHRLTLLILLVSGMQSFAQSPLSLQVINTISPTFENEYHDGVIIVSASGGTAPYKYRIAGNDNYYNIGYFPVLAAGTHPVTVFDAAGQQASLNVVLSSGPPPLEIRVTDVQRVTGCNAFDGSVTLTANGGTPPYQYSIDNINYQSDNIFTGLSDGRYYYYVKDAAGSIAREDGWATQSLLHPAGCITPSIVTPPGGACGNDAYITIDAGTSGGPYTYSLNGTGYQPSGQFTGLGPGIHRVYIKNAVGNISVFNVDIPRECNYWFQFNATGTNCGQNNGTLTVTPSGEESPYTYTIDGVNYQVSNVFSNLAAGPYWFTVRDNTGRKRTVETIVNNFCPVSVTTTILAQTTCGKPNGIITATAINGTYPYQYSINGRDFQSSNTFTGLAAGDYIMTAKDATSRTASITFTIKPSTSNITVEAGADLFVCKGKSTRIIPASNGTSFTWSPAATLDDPNVLSPLASPVTSTKYYITAKLGGCEAIDSVIVNVRSLPIAIAGDGHTICKGQNATLNGSGGVLYQWSPATYLSDPLSRNPVVNNPLSPITYQLQVEDENGCRSVQPSLVTIDVRSNLKIFAGNDTSIAMDQPFRLSATDINNAGFTTYRWSPSTGLDDPLSQHPIVTSDRDMIYKVTASIQGGCEVTDEIKIKVYKGPEIYIPNAFTPNNDGLNDDFRVTLVGIKKFKHLIIFNCWGQRIFYTTDPSRSWNGKNASMSLDAGIYVWIAEGIDDKGQVIQKKGTITLVR